MIKTSFYYFDFNNGNTAYQIISGGGASEFHNIEFRRNDQKLNGE